MALLGRTQELKTAETGLDATAAGRGGVHLLSGEPGIGKTRLAEEISARASARGMSVAWGRAWETGGAPPFYPWIEILDGLGGPDAGAPALEQMGASRGDGASADPTRERFAVYTSVMSFLRASSKKAPVLAIVDDLHAADVPSLELLHFLSRGVRAAPIMVVGTLRDVEAKRAPVADVLARIGREAKHLSLKALGADEVRALVIEHTGKDDAVLVSKVLSLTDGNPLFVHETLRALAERSDGASPLATATGVFAVIASRVTGLPDEVTALLESASVLGRDVGVAALAAATKLPVGQVTRSLDDLAERGVLHKRGDASFRFTHMLVRDAFYERIPPERRREIHRAIATSLSEEGDRHAMLVAHHMLAALPLVGSGDAIRAAIAAADVARRKHAHEEAVALLERTSASIESLPLDEKDRIELLLALGWAATGSGALARGRQVFREASRRASATSDAVLLARAALGQGGEYVFGEVRDELVTNLREALGALGKPSSDLRARLLGRLAAALQPSANPEEPIALAREALAIGDGIADPRVRADIALSAGSALTDFAPPDVRLVANQDLVRTARAIDDAVLELRGLTRLATDWMEVGDFARAALVVEERADLAARIGHPRYMWQTPLMRSMLAMPNGEFAQCDESIEEARAIAQEALDTNASLVIARHRFWMLQVRGDTEGLREHVPEILRAMDRMPDPARHHALVHAVVASRSGEHAAALEALERIGDARHMEAPTMTSTIAGAALLAHDTRRFPALYEKLRGLRNRNAAWGPFAFVCGPPYETLVGSLAAALGKVDEARAAFESALGLARSARAPASEAWVRLAMGEALWSWADPSANEHLKIAARLAKAHGMPDVERRATASGQVSSGPASSQTSGPASAPISTRSSAPSFSLEVEGKDVRLVYDGRTTKLRTVRGLPMLARLVASPGQEMHVLDLAADPDDEGGVVDRGDAGEILDAKAREAYRQRIAELREEVDEADRFADVGRADNARRELDMLIQQLSGAVGLGGRERRAGAAAERARIVVQRRVREAIKKIGEHEPDLGRHLDWAIRTGTFCAYEPLGKHTAR